MQTLNRVQILGRLTRDPEGKELESGQIVSNFSIATNERYKNRAGEEREETDFHNVVAWGGLAKVVSQYARKGSALYVEGKLKVDNWTDDHDVKHYRIKIVAERVILLDRKPQTEEGSRNTRQGETEETDLF